MEDYKRMLEEKNRALAQANARAAELVAALEQKTKALEEVNAQLGQANARSAELLADLQLRREEIEWANVSLKQANEEIKRMLATVAHDIRSGLGGIQSLAEMLAMDLDERSEGREQAELIGKKCRQLLELLEDFLKEARDGLGEFRLRRTPVRLEEVAEDVVRFHRDHASKKRQHLGLEVCGDPVPVSGDQVRLYQVLENLVSNAIKYSPPGSRITLQLCYGPGEVRCNVLDEGPGLTEEDLGKVFGEFARLSAKPTGGETSHGLGLYIVKRIVERHGGRVWAENRPCGRGACFGFRIPTEAADQISPSRAA
jgi:signal transduction histidine kinase